MGRGHPECPQRLDAIDDHLLASGLDVALDRREAPLRRPRRPRARAQQRLRRRAARPARAGRAPTAGRARSTPTRSPAPGTWHAVLRAAGAAVAATDAVIDGEVENAFCAVRPPGHHATRDAAMGFCFFNNVAVAARHALDVRGLERVAIVDFDVHHGNGTEDIIAGDERVLMVEHLPAPALSVQRRRADGRPTWSTCRCRRTRAGRRCAR